MDLCIKDPVREDFTSLWCYLCIRQVIEQSFILIKMSEKKNYPPSWLNEEYIGKIFSDYVNRGRDQVQSIDWDCEIEYFDKKLENLSTNLFKIKVTNRKNPKEVYNAIAKTLSQKVSNHFEVRLNLQTILFEREGILYENHLNEISKILNKIDENTMIIPKLYYFSVDPLLIIIEDMSSSGFKKYIEPYSLEDCINIFKNLGKFHAASYYLHHECKWDFSECKNFLGQNFVDDAKIMTMAYQDFQEVVATWDNCSEFADKLKKFEPHYPDSLEKVGKENPPGGINVLSHGDFHKHNFLMRNDVMNCVFVRLYFILLFYSYYKVYIYFSD